MTRRIWAGVAFIAVGAIAGFDCRRLADSVPLERQFRQSQWASIACSRSTILARAISSPLLRPTRLQRSSPNGAICRLISHFSNMWPGCRDRSSAGSTAASLSMGSVWERRSIPTVVGRPMPVWQGCRRITSDEVFLMNPDARDSLDGRYFGPIPRNALLAEAIPIWTAEDHAAHQPSSSDVIDDTLFTITSTP